MSSMSIDHEARRNGIGGSDIGALIGASPHRTQYQLWLEKTNRHIESAPDEAARERMHFGTVLEAVVSAEYVRRTDATVQRVNAPLQHHECPIARANIDRAVVRPGSRARWDSTEHRLLGAVGILECKTAHALAVASDEWGAAGTSDVPLHYYLQVQWYLGVARVEYGQLAVLFGGQHFRVYDIPADPALFASLLERADAWWRRHVIGDTPPDPTTEDEARERWPQHRVGRSLIVGPETAQAVRQYADLKREIAELEARAQCMRDQVCAAFEDAESITHAGQVIATWKTSKPSIITDWRALVHHHWPVPPAELVEQFTVVRPGARRLLIKETTS